MKKYLFSALALPLLFACSDELIEKPVASNDPYPGIEKVNATFYMDEEPITRMDNGTGWTLANGDLYGFAWMGDGEIVGAEPEGLAYQNHNLIQTNGRFEPQTSIYVGKYYIYRPYDETTVSPQAINFNSLKEQPLAEGMDSKGDAWKKLAESAIIIADKWTDIDPAGRTYQKEDGSNDETIWNQPGIAKPYKVFAAFFSNQTGLDLTYENNNPTFDNAQNVKGATDIDYDIAADESAGAADIYGATVQLAGAANAFTYAPTEEPNNEEYPKVVNGKTVYHNSEFWADKKASQVDGFTWSTEAATGTTVDPEVAADVITLNAPASAPIGTGAEGSKGFFWFNSLPVTSQNAATGTTQVVTTIKTSYGTVTIGGDDAEMTLGDCAYAWDKISGEYQWIKLTDEADVTNKAKGKNSWNIANHNTFVNQFGNHKGKYSLDVDFSTAVMDIHIVNDEHLQKYLKFYMASGKQDAVELVLDGDNDKSFKLSKLSIAMLQTINRGADKKVLVKACDVEDHNAPANGKVKIIVTQDGQSASLAAKKEVPTLNDVFAEPTPVYLAAKNSKGTDITWTWGGEYDGETATANEALTIDENVDSLVNEGTITVNCENIQLSKEGVTIANAVGATMNITKVTTVKNPLINRGTINVGAADNKNAELRAYDIDITNDAVDMLTPENIIAKEVPADAEVGIINNWGVVGVSDGTDGQFFNYGGMIYMKIDEAMTFLTSNELIAGEATSAFSSAFAADNKMGTVVLPQTENGPYAIVSVANKAENGFITYDWTEPTYEHNPGNVKYNTIVVSSDITFQGDAYASEIQFIMFNGTKTKVVNPGVPVSASRLNKLKGVIVPDDKSFILEKTNRLKCLVGAFVGDGATIYKGGEIVLPEGATTNYFGNWDLDQIVKW